ncbi:hypothetical protein ZWY2020_046924 [Hordeum vulgare]|nr:hypothetical protein ZWY2020_046908 [Hordeum vulgare]KAI5006976.1 hypothetical protein ZWY2020_046924 [Hordeum vulgare]
MEGDERQPLLAASPASSTPSRNGTSASDELSGERMRRAPSHPPVPAPPGLRETLRRQGARFDSVGVEKLIGILGFSLFGSLSLLPFTVDRVKDDSNITETHKIILVLIFGLIWVLASVGFLCGLHGKSDFEQAVCRFTARLGILGLTLLVILNLIWMLPSSTFATVCFYIFMIAAVILHIVLWITSCLVGEDKIEEIAGTEQQ